ncbi:hypothetical protein bcgnr5406_27940 [Bacillus cereus]
MTKKLLVFIKGVFKNTSHPVWVLLQQVISRGLIAIKFLVLARFLGPDLLGQLTFTLIGLGIIEGLTEMGLMHAVIQSPKAINNYKYNIIWSVQVIRGILIGGCFFIVYYYITKIGYVEYSIILILLLSTLPIIKNLISIKYFEATRNREFRPIAILQLITVTLDIVLTVVFLRYQIGLQSVIFAMVLSELLKTLLSYKFFMFKPKFTIKIKEIKELSSYGKWIFGNSVLTIVSNQLDKVLTTTFLGTRQLGIYQMSFKLAQLGIADIALALSQYLFPTFSLNYRKDRKQGNVVFIQAFNTILIFSIGTFCFMWLNMDLIIHIVLGPDWVEAVETTKYLLINMTCGAIISVLVAFVRAIGKPEIATKGTFIQVVLFSIIGTVGVMKWGLNGLIMGIIGSIITSTIYIMYKINKEVNNFFKEAIKGFLYSMPLLLMLSIEFITNNIWLIAIVSVIFYSIILLRVWNSFKKIIN